jgi:hypothetical protein
MTTLSRVRVESVEGPRLTCHVDHVYGSHWPWCLVSSRTLALHFLAESLRSERPGQEMTWQQAEDLMHAAPLWPVLGDYDHDEDWNRENAGRFVACVGMVDHQNCDEMWADLTHPGWEDDPDAWETKEKPSARCIIAVTDPRWIAHLAPGMEWDSTAYDHDAPVKFDPQWRTSDVLGLARGINADLAFDRMPILADALQDAGCDNDELLNHFRDTSATHVRGCWALGLVLSEK